MSQSKTQCHVHALDHLVLTVQNIDATVGFYTQVLGMRADQFIVADGTRRWALYFGLSKINLHQTGHEFDPKAATPTPGSSDLCFRTNATLDVWISHLEKHQIAVEEGPVPRSGAIGPITSLYVRDPDLNLIEIAVRAP